jgi:hypothetical protein
MSGYLGSTFLSSMAHMENYDLGVGRVDRVKDQIRVVNGWKHADAGLVGEMTRFGKILEQAGDSLDALNHCDRGCAIMLVNVGEYIVDVRKCALGPAYPYAL